MYEFLISMVNKIESLLVIENNSLIPIFQIYTYILKRDVCRYSYDKLDFSSLLMIK